MQERLSGDLLAAHVAAALRRHAAWLRARGVRPPPGWEAVEALFGARERQGATRLDGPAEAGDGGSVQPLLHDFVEAGHLLGGLSKRTVQRLVEAGEIPAVTLIGCTRRIAAEDLSAYVSRLRGVQDPPDAA